MEYITGITFDQVKNMYLQKGYDFFDKLPYQVNLCGFRNRDISTVDEFNDYLGVAYLDEFLNKHFLIFRGTTKPGLTSLSGKPMNPNGTFILAPGQHKKSWMTGFHHANDPEKRYEAYVQSGPGVFKGWRDNDQDGRFDFDGVLYSDVSGLNGHRAGVNDTNKVGPYSYACQVVRDDKEHSIWLGVGKRCAEIYGNIFHYTLFQLA